MTDCEKWDIQAIVTNSLDLCGSYTDEVNDFCKVHCLDVYSPDVQDAIFEAVKNYGKEG